MNTKLLAFALFISALTFGQTASTLSGTNNPQIVAINGGYNNDIGSKSTFKIPIAIATTKEGVSYVADSQIPVVRKIEVNGTTTEDAGNHDFSSPYYTGWGYVNGFNTNVRINNPQGFCADSNGNIIIADTYNNVIRKRLTTGEYVTVAGSGIAGLAEGQGTAAQFNRPHGVCVDAVGNIYVADTGNKRIRKITPSGLVSTVNGTFVGLKYPTSLAIDSQDNLYICDKSAYAVKKVTPTGILTVVVSGVNANGIVRDSKGNFYFTDSTNIKKISSTGVVSIWVDNKPVREGTQTWNLFETPTGISIDGQDNVYVCNGYKNCILKITPQ